jgi:hypothetical protein
MKSDDVAEGQDTIAIAHRQTRLADERYASCLEFNRERLATNRFQETAPKFPMNGHSDIDNRVGLRIVEVLRHATGKCIRRSDGTGPLAEGARLLIAEPAMKAVL